MNTGGVDTDVAAEARRVELVRLNPILRPLRLARKLPLALLSWRGDGDEVGAFAAAFDDLIRNPLVGEPEMPLRFLEWRVDDRIFNDHLFHG